MDTFAQQFTTSWISGGVRIKVQMSNFEVQTVWHLDNAVDTGTATHVFTDWSMYDSPKSWTPGEWIGYYIGFSTGTSMGEIRSITNSFTNELQWSPSKPMSYNGGDAYGIFITSTDFYSSDDTFNYGTGVIPNILKLELFVWDNTYTATVAGSPIVTDYTTVASEEIDDNECWVYLFWKPLSIGTYMWRITPVFGDDTCSLKVLYDPDSVKFQSWKNTSSLSGDYYSEVMGLDSETYENVMSEDDAFDSSFIADDGVSNVKVNKSSTYYNAIKTGNVATTAGGLKGRIATGSSVRVV